MTIKDFEKEQAKLLKDPDIRDAWLEYLSGTRTSALSSDPRTAVRKPNQHRERQEGRHRHQPLQALSPSRCFNLLRKGGYCGIVIPSGIYTDLGAKQLREMLFSQTQDHRAFLL